MREETVYKSDLVGEKQAESQAERTGGRPEVALEEIETSGVCDGHCDRRGH